MTLSTLVNRAVRAVRLYFHREWDLETLLNVNDHVTPYIRRHLEQVISLQSLSLFLFLPSFVIEFLVFWVFFPFFCNEKLKKLKENRGLRV